MRRPSLVLAGTVALLAAVPAAPAAAKITELGSFSDDPAPTCPQKANPTAPSDFCRIVTRTTGYQQRSGPHFNPLVAPGNGRIVAFTLRLGDLTKAQISKANATYGGSSRVRLVALRKIKSRKGKFYREAIGQTNSIFTAPFFGGTTQFALTKSLIVKKGDIIGVTVPTWAPMLALGEDDDEPVAHEPPGGVLRRLHVGLDADPAR